MSRKDLSKLVSFSDVMEELQQVSRLLLKFQAHRLERGESWEARLGVCLPQATKDVTATMQIVLMTAKIASLKNAAAEDTVIAEPALTSLPSPNDKLCDEEREVLRKVQGLTPPSRILLGDAAKEMFTLAEIRQIMTDHHIESEPPKPEQ